MSLRVVVRVGDQEETGPEEGLEMRVGDQEEHSRAESLMTKMNQIMTPQEESLDESLLLMEASLLLMMDLGNREGMVQMRVVIRVVDQEETGTEEGTEMRVGDQEERGTEEGTEMRVGDQEEGGTEEGLETL